MKEYLLGIDLGTSGTKTVLFRSDGTAMAAHTVEYPLYQPQNGWAEQEPSDWWRAVRETVQAVLHKSGVAAADVAGVGISGQMHGLVMLDERGEVLHRSILWCDGRTGEECREITETVGAEKLIAITANPALAGADPRPGGFSRREDPVGAEASAGGLQGLPSYPVAQGLHSLLPHRPVCHRGIRRLRHEPAGRAPAAVV